jgi:transcriptional regulator with XRE-family HTH domain
MARTVKAETYSISQVKDAIKDTGAIIQAARKERGWSQSDLGDRLGGVDRRQIGAMESGNPSVDFGLVVSALWLLNVPILANLAYPENGSYASKNYNLMKKGIVGKLQPPKAKETTYRISPKGSKGSPSPVVRKRGGLNNDF